MIPQWMARQVFAFVETYRELDKPEKQKPARAYRKPTIITDKSGKRFRVGFGK